jgi:hypothetical protein
MSLHINRFLDRLRAAESKGQRDLVMSLAEARDLHSDITRILAKLEKTQLETKPESIQVEIKGGSF